MKQHLVRAAATLLAFGLLTSVTALAQQQGQGQGRGERGFRGRGMATFMFVERSWAVVCLGVGASQEQINKLLPAYRDAWKKRMDALKKAQAAKDQRAGFEEFAKVAEKIRTDLEAKLKQVLTPDQFRNYQTLMQPPMFGRGAGPGQGPGPVRGQGARGPQGKPGGRR
ncbi:MAG: hypothetical protein H5T86_00515 [Armatimonadetes bacterium]|nr:hypothetical protein [Armatimonadota bacterium]